MKKPKSLQVSPLSYNLNEQALYVLAITVNIWNADM